MNDTASFATGRDADSLAVAIPDLGTVDADLVGTDASTDIAVGTRVTLSLLRSGRVREVDLATRETPG